MDVSPNVYRKLVGKCVGDWRRVRDSRENATPALSQHSRNLFNPLLWNMRAREKRVVVDGPL